MIEHHFCLSCKQWQRMLRPITGDLGVCLDVEDRKPFHSLRFQFEGDDCLQYTFGEHRAPFIDRRGALNLAVAA